MYKIDTKVSLLLISIPLIRVFMEIIEKFDEDWRIHHSAFLMNNRY